MSWEVQTMKSRISFCNWAVIRKDVIRFAPLWAVYFIGGLLVMLTELSGEHYALAATYLTESIAPLAVINFIYAAICAQAVFGDLFNARLCNALHALPLRRETWFGSHVLSGLAVSVVPHTVGALVLMPLLGQFWYVTLLWLLAMVLQYLFFFGLAVFSIMCTGNRVAMAAVYTILNFASMLAAWLMETLYMPLLHGVRITTDVFTWLCPVVKMAAYTQMVQAEAADSLPASTVYYASYGEGWRYTAVCAAVGIGLLFAALLLYRRRKLESAGDFVALKQLEPVFAVVFTLCAGCVFALVQQLMGDEYLLFLCVGLVVGWFVGQMLLQRTVRVFYKKSFLKLAVMVVALGGSLLLTWLDPVGITRWIPDAGQVTKVELSLSGSIRTTGVDYLEATDEQQIQAAIDVHRLLCAERPENGSRITLRYTLSDGKTVSRTYRIGSGEAMTLLKSMYRDPQQLLGYTDWDSYVNQVNVYLEWGYLKGLCTEYVKESGEYETQEALDAAIRQLTQQMQRSLLEAIAQDYREGLLPQILTDKEEHKFFVELEYPGNGSYRYRDIQVLTTSQNTMLWYEKYKDVLNAE